MKTYDVTHRYISQTNSYADEPIPAVVTRNAHTNRGMIRIDPARLRDVGSPELKDAAISGA